MLPEALLSMDSGLMNKVLLFTDRGFQWSAMLSMVADGMGPGAVLHMSLFIILNVGCINNSPHFVKYSWLYIHYGRRGDEGTGVRTSMAESRVKKMLQLDAELLMGLCQSSLVLFMLCGLVTWCSILWIPENTE